MSESEKISKLKWDPTPSFITCNFLGIRVFKGIFPAPLFRPVVFGVYRLKSYFSLFVLFSPEMAITCWLGSTFPEPVGRMERCRALPHCSPPSCWTAIVPLSYSKLQCIHGAPVPTHVFVCLRSEKSAGRCPASDCYSGRTECLSH